MNIIRKKKKKKLCRIRHKKGPFSGPSNVNVCQSSDYQKDALLSIGLLCYFLYASFRSSNLNT